MKKQTETSCIRYALTMINKDGYRVLANANQGRNHFLEKADAEKHLDDVLKNNSEETLRSVFGDISKMRVDPIECYAHGDAKGIYIQDQPNETN